MNPTKMQSVKVIFEEIYRNNIWGGGESRSGTGSTLEQTRVIRAELPALIQRLGIASMLDIPCGDWFWMREMALDVDYIGADVVPEIVNEVAGRFGGERRDFRVLDLIRDDLPRVDLVFCRDAIVHLSFEDGLRAVENIVRSGSKYLMATTFTAREKNSDIHTGQWRALNMTKAPFYFPEPLELINEECSEDHGNWQDKSLGMWRIDSLSVNV